MLRWKARYKVSLQFFAPKGADGKSVQIPLALRRTVKWLPQIGDIFPDFVVNTTAGKLKFWDWAEGSWTFFFSHPAAYTPVCTTEMGAIAKRRQDFEALGVKALSLTGSTVDEQIEWHRDIETVYDAPIWFPSACDPVGSLTALFGMNHDKESAQWPIRKSFILDQNMRIKMIFEYPVYVGRSIEETLRVIEALQLVDRAGVGTPADWFPNDPVIIPDEMAESEVMHKFGGQSRQVLPYLRLAPAKCV